MKLKEFRLQKGITQSRIALLLGVAKNTYFQYENNIRTVPVEVYVKLADIFNVSVDELLGRTTAPTLFDNARIERPRVLELYEQLTAHQQDLIMERMQAYIDTNCEYDNQKHALVTPMQFVPGAHKQDKKY